MFFSLLGGGGGVAPIPIPVQNILLSGDLRILSAKTHKSLLLNGGILHVKCNIWTTLPYFIDTTKGS